MSSAANANDPLLPGYQAGARTIGSRREVASRVAGVGIEPTWFQAYEAWQGPALPALSSEPWEGSEPPAMSSARQSRAALDAIFILLRAAEGLNLAGRFWRPA